MLETIQTFWDLYNQLFLYGYFGSILMIVMSFFYEVRNGIGEIKVEDFRHVLLGAAVIAIFWPFLIPYMIFLFMLEVVRRVNG